MQCHFHRTYRINAERIRTSENVSDIGVQRQIPITSESLLTTHRHRERLSELHMQYIWPYDEYVCVCVSYVQL